MKSIRCCLQARLFRDAEIKVSKSGNKYVTFAASIDTGDKKAGDQYAPNEWIRVIHTTPKGEPDDYPDAMAAKLQRGNEVYCEGDLEARPWKDKDGNPKAGLQMMAWTCVPMGVFRRPARHDDEGRPAQSGMDLPPDEPKKAGPAVDSFSDSDVPF